jgi:hypothetical protein
MPMNSDSADSDARLLFQHGAKTLPLKPLYSLYTDISDCFCIHQSPTSKKCNNILVTSASLIAGAFKSSLSSLWSIAYRLK